MPTPSEIAWMAAPPCALALLAAIVLLGPPLGGLLAPAANPGFQAVYVRVGIVRPEPTEHARYLLAQLGPLLVSGVVLLRARARLPAWPEGAIRALVGLSQALLVAFAVVAILAQRSIVYAIPYAEAPFRTVYFTWPTLVFALAAAALLAAATQREALVARVGAWTRETPRRRLAAGAVALLVTATWLLTAINSDGSAGHAPPAVSTNLAIWADEAFSLLNGQAPLVSFHAQYSQLWPYLAAGVMSLLGASLGVYTVTMATGSGVALLLVFGVLRRVTRSAVLALALFLPFLATSLFTQRGPLANRYGPSNVLSMFPMRYGGPYLLAWLTTRELERARPHGRVLLFAAAGLVVLNNPEFGAPALGATLAALVWAGAVRRANALRVLGELALGLAGAAAATAALTLLVAGSLPRFGLLLEFPRIYGLDGFGMLPMKALGLHLVLYATFAAAIVAATVRAVAREEDVLLTGMLAWAGVFGLGAGGYFAGRSHPEVLIDLFSAWALALVLLVVVALRAIRARPTRRPTLAELAVLAGFGVMVCSLAQIPTPWSQLQRLGNRTATPLFTHNQAERLIAGATRPGDRVVILTPLGHRVAEDLGLVDVSPYASSDSTPLTRQFRSVIDALRGAHGRTLFLPADATLPERGDMLERAGYPLVRIDAGTNIAIFAERR